MAKLSPDIIKKIVNDIAPLSKTLLRVGLVGSYARNEEKPDSDVDLVFSAVQPCIDEPIEIVALPIRMVLMNQFRTGLDVINYDTILKRIDESNEKKYCIDGYKKMLEDLIWIWER